MASTAHVIKRLSHFAPVRGDGRGRFWAEHAGHVVSFIDQQGEAICLRCRRVDDHDDLMADYHAGVYVDNIAQALRLARWMPPERR